MDFKTTKNILEIVDFCVYYIPLHRKWVIDIVLSKNMTFQSHQFKDSVLGNCTEQLFIKDDIIHKNYGFFLGLKHENY